MSGNMLVTAEANQQNQVVWAGGGPVLLVNRDAATEAYFGAEGFDPAGQSVTPLDPGGSLQVDGDDDLWTATQSGTAQIAVIPGGTGYTAGKLVVNLAAGATVEITGDPEVNLAPGTVVDLAPGTTVEVSSGSIDVASGTVSLAAGTTVNLASGTTVNIGSGNTVSLASGTSVTISGTTTVTITGTPTVIGGGGYIAPGQLAELVITASAMTAGPAASVSRGPFNVSTYSSVQLNTTVGSNSSTAAGAAVCAVWQFQWQDAAGNVIATDIVSEIIGAGKAVLVPVKGSQLLLVLQNIGSVGSITYPAGNVALWGDYRIVDDIKVLGYTPPATPPTITGFTVITPQSPVGVIQGWLANMDISAEVASTSYLMPIALWRGPVSGWYQQITQALANNAIIADITYAQQGSIAVGTSYANGIAANLPSAAATSETLLSYYSPGTQLAIIFKAGTTAGGQTFLMLNGGD